MPHPGHTHFAFNRWPGKGNLGSSLSLVLIFSHEWSFHLKVHFLVRNILQVVVRELVLFSSFGGTNMVSQSSSLCGVSSVSCFNVSCFKGLERLLGCSNTCGFSFVNSKSLVSLVIINVGTALWETSISRFRFLHIVARSEIKLLSPRIDLI